MSQVLALVDDLMFLSRIREAARGVGVDVRSVRRPEELVAGVRAGARLVLIDADSPRLPWGDALASLEADGLLSRTSTVAFFSHVHAARGEAAREAGCHRVVPRGTFVQQLPKLLEDAAAPRPPMEETAP